MAAPYVQVKELDISTRVPSFPGIYVGIVLPDSKKGIVNTPVLQTSESQFLANTTPQGTVKVGYDNSYFSALAVLQKTNKLWTVRPQTTGMLCGGAGIQPLSGNTASASFTTGIYNPDAYTFSTESFIVAGKDPGAYNNYLSVQIYNYKFAEVGTLATATAPEIGQTFTVTQNWGTGYPVILSTSSVLPAPLSPLSTYFIINVSATTVKLAASLNDAVAGLAITLTSAGTGVTTIRPQKNFTSIPGTFLVNIYGQSNKNQPLDSFVCSKTQGAKDGYGRNIYLEQVFESSSHVQIINNGAVTDTYVKDVCVPVSLTGGSDGTSATDGQCIQALSTLSGTTLPLTLVIDGGRTTPAYQQAIISLCESRMDCVGILSTPYQSEDSANYLNAVIDYRNYQLNANTSYAALYSSSVLIYDEFNDRTIFVSPDGFVAALISATAANFEIWYPVAGFRRGIMNVLDVRRRWTDGEMDYLYDNGVNPIRFAPGQGIVIWGQKTLQSMPSSLDRLNVRLLLITIEPAIKAALQYFLFELNDATTRALAKSAVDSYMYGIQSRRGVYNFNTVCDNSNNPPSAINNYTMNLDLYIQPTLSIEYINFTVVIEPTGISLTLAQAEVRASV